MQRGTFRAVGSGSHLSIGVAFHWNISFKAPQPLAISQGAHVLQGIDTVVIRVFGGCDCGHA